MSDYKKYYNWKWATNLVIKAIPRAVLGSFVFAGIMRRREKTYYLVLPPTLGDSILALSYLSEFKRQKDIDHVTVVCTPHYVKRLCRYYPDAIDAVICKSKRQISVLRGFIDTHLGQYLSTLYLDRATFVFLTCNVSMRTLWDNPSIDFPLYAKAILYKIDMSSQPERPHIPSVDVPEFVRKYHLKQGHTVFLNPVANSVHCNATGLLAATAAKLTAKGYMVVTMTANAEGQPIQGTQAIPCTLEEAYFLAEYGGTVIGVRSGFLDVLAYARCKIISLIDEGNGLENFFRLEKLGINEDCHTVICNGDDEAVLQTITGFVETEMPAGTERE